MCGRYTIITDVSDLAEDFGAEVDSAFQAKPRYNVAPSQTVPVIAVQEGKRILQGMHWGLVPFWAKEKSIGYKMINARSETIAEKPAFKQALLKRRCLLLADGFYEWRKDGAVKTPMWIRLKNEEPFLLAGLWESWHPPDDRESTLLSTTIITTAANDFMKPIHDRMPVILSKKDAEAWLDESIKDAAKLTRYLNPFPAEAMTAHPVSILVNSPKNDRPECIEPAAY